MPTKQELSQFLKRFFFSWRGNLNAVSYLSLIRNDGSRSSLKICQIRYQFLCQSPVRPRGYDDDDADEKDDDVDDDDYDDEDDGDFVVDDSSQLRYCCLTKIE